MVLEIKHCQFYASNRFQNIALNMTSHLVLVKLLSLLMVDRYKYVMNNYDKE